MDSKLDLLLKKMKLLVELQAKEAQFRYKIRQRKIHFTAAATVKTKSLTLTHTINL